MFTIEGLQEAQEANLHNIRALRPTSNFGRAIQVATVLAEQSAVVKTHVLTGTLRASHRMKINGLRGVIYIDPQAANPRTKQKPSVYGVYEHNRGGSHAFYERVEREDGTRIAENAANELRRGLR